MYQIYKLVRGSVAVNIFIGLTSIYLVWQIVKVLRMEMLSGILGQFIELGVLAIVIVFQQEIRKFLLFIGSTNLKSRQNFINQFHFFKEENKDSSIDIQSILETCISLSKTYTGALIVLERTNKLDFLYNSSGDKVKAEVNRNLLESIFYKNSPLHDGAVVISKNTIIATRVILPVSTQNIPKRLGLRHRAALGITEHTDAVCLVVSEETGAVSYIKEGNITTKISPIDLTEILKDDMRDI